MTPTSPAAPKKNISDCLLLKGRYHVNPNAATAANNNAFSLRASLQQRLSEQARYKWKRPRLAGSEDKSFNP
jgi:hypothetical protein